MTAALRSFSITELLVVIGIIALLVSLLLVALGGVRTRALATQTTLIMDEFAKACETFQLDHRRYPGVIPEDSLLRPDNSTNGTLSGTENALLELMGGYITNDHPAYTSDPNYNGVPNVYAFSYDGGRYQIKVRPDLMGQGPTINGKTFGSYFAPDARSLRRTLRQNRQANIGDIAKTSIIPDLIDGWGQPIIYLRQARPIGQLVGEGASVGTSQFFRVPADSYLLSDALGELGLNQTRTNQNQNYSVLNVMDNDTRLKNLAQIIRHPGLGNPAAADALNGTPRGAFILISAGPDGIFFARQQYLNSAGQPRDAIDPATDVREFDDLIVSGGAL
jgi:type II secretory pathway pseudopilin PulG